MTIPQNTQSKEFLIDEETGRVKGVRTTLVEWNKDPDTGRWVLSEVPDSEKVYPCQLVLLAMGFLGPEQNLVKTADLETDNRYTQIRISFFLHFRRCFLKRGYLGRRGKGRCQYLGIY